MIVELFGPPGVGKTTLALALAARLRERGHGVRLALSYRPSEYLLTSRAEGLARPRIPPALRRLTRPMAESFAAAAHSVDSCEARAAAELMRLLAPRNVVWSLRLRQYMLRLSRTWRAAALASDIVLFDQGFIQAVCTLALLARATDPERLGLALDAVPKPDLLVRLDAPLEILETRLAERRCRQGRIEQLFDIDAGTNLGSVWIFDQLHELLRARGWPVTCVDSTDQRSLGEGVDGVEGIMVVIEGKVLAGPSAGQDDAGLMKRARADRAVVVRVQSAPQARGAEAGGGPSQPDGLATRLARGSAAALVVYVAGASLTYCAQLAVARTIGADGYGVYAYVFAWMTVLAYVSALGFDVSLLRFVPTYLVPHAFALLRGVIRYAARRAAVVGCVIAVTGVAAILSRSGELPPDLANTFLVGFALVPILALLWICAAVVRGFGGVVWALAPDRMMRDGTLLGLVLLASAGAGWRIDAPWAMVATLLGSVAGLGLVSLAMRRLRPGAADCVAPAYDARTWRRTALPLVVIGASEALMNRTGVMVLGWMADTRDAGIYALAFNIAFAVALPRTAVNALLAPAISDLFVRNNHAALRTIVAKAASWSLLGAAGIALPLMVLAEPLLNQFGRDFQAGVPALRILLIGQLIAAAAGSQLHLMTMTGRERSAAVQLVSSVAVNAAVGAALVSPLGPTGAALAATTALIGWNTAMGLSIWQNLRLLPGVLAAWPDKARHIAGGSGTAAE